MPLERVQKVLSNSGYCARRKAEALIEQGRVKVNGKRITLGDKADPEKDKIFVDGNRIKTAVKKKYLLLNKPKGFLVTCDDPKRRKTIFDLMRIKEKLIPVGRLDMDTEGLIILTNDGYFANRVIHPRYELNKTYKVWVDRKIDDKVVARIRAGVQLDEYKTRPAKARKLSSRLLEITLHEGKNRIIKKMMEALGYKVVALERTKLGRIKIGNLKRGKFRNLRKDEIECLLKSRN